MSDSTVRIGIGGWTYPPWRETFYPRDLPQRRELEYASQQFSALEINATFYGRQKPQSWKNWAAAVPDGFQFAVKGSRFCVTRTRLCEGGEGIANFLAQGLTELGSKLGPILWQFAPRRIFDREDIAGFIALLPERQDGIELRHAIEPRHESFRDEGFLQLCRDRNIAVVLEDSDQYPTIDADTSDFRYARLQRMREELQTGYDETSLERFAGMARSWSKSGRDSYIFMINGAKARAPAAATELQKLLLA